MFDLNPHFGDDNTPRYDWLYVRVCLDANVVTLLRQFPQLVHTNVFVPGPTNDTAACAKANWDMVVWCLKLNFGLNRDNCLKFDTLMVNLNNTTNAYFEAVQLSIHQQSSTQPQP